jgi:hypothetical protein
MAAMNCHNKILFIKQQGAMRTGTNLVKFALEENFTNTHVLVNIGRWKHTTADAPFNWRGANWEGNGINVEVSSRINETDLTAVRNAFDAGEIKFAISVRDVYSWLESYLQFTLWDDTEPLPLSAQSHEQIIKALKEWNRLYRSYLPILAEGNRGMLFRLEDLLTNFTETMDKARLLWNLSPRHACYVEPALYLKAGIDGESRSQLFEESTPFDRQRYLSNSHLAKFDDQLLSLVRETVDEDLIRAYGYRFL